MIEMFTKKDFDIFKIEGLEARMKAIRKNIQPKFQQLDEYFVEQLAVELGEKLPIHIAQHRRRTANAPDFTWSAMGGDKRGYKKYPHFQLGITENYLVMWLSFIDNPQHEQRIAQDFLENKEWFQQLPNDFVVNVNHTKNNYETIREVEIKQSLIRWRDVKKAEFQVGRVLTKEDLLLNNPKLAREYMLHTYIELLPLYKRALKISTSE